VPNEIFNIPLPVGLVLQSVRSKEGTFQGKYSKIPLDENMRGILESRELLQRDMREYLIEKANGHQWDLP
jgi:hypothetical protein